MIERRSLLGFLGVAIAAPAIVKATSLMKLPRPRRSAYDQVSMRWLDEYNVGFAHERVDVLFGSLQTRPLFLKHIDEQYQAKFGVEGAKIGTQLRIRMPNDYMMVNGPGLSLQDVSEPSYVELYRRDTPPVIPDSLALTAAAVVIAPAVLKTPVTRRFW